LFNLLVHLCLPVHVFPGKGDEKSNAEGLEMTTRYLPYTK
jgi:hypothetical protein